MKSSHDSSSETHFDRIATLSIELGQQSSQTWSYSFGNHDLCFQMSDFNVVITSISCLNNSLNLLARIFHANGKTFMVPSAFREIFLALANENAQNFHFFTEQDGKQLLLKCSLSFHPDLSIKDNINHCANYLQRTLPSFERALQAVGLKSKSNKFSFQMLKQKLILKKNIITTMNSASESAATHLFTSTQAQNSSVIRVKAVVEKSLEHDKQSFNKKGGYFSVQKKNSIIQQHSGAEEQKLLAWKTPINLTNHRNMLQSKIKKEIQYVSKIIDDKFLLNYYVSDTQPDLIFMNYVPTLLKDQIYQENVSFSRLLNLAQQLIEAVTVLHKSGIVHRDLKPENILIQGESVKIIDYAESALVSQNFNSQNCLGYTLPYSAFECSLGKEEGFNRKEIDLWSISIILYEMAFKSLPLFYTRWIGADILDIWRSTSDFSIFPLYRKGRGLRGVEQVISLISIRGIQMNQKDRLSLVAYQKMLCHIQQFYECLMR